MNIVRNANRSHQSANDNRVATTSPVEQEAQVSTADLKGCPSAPRPFARRFATLVATLTVALGLAGFVGSGDASAAATAAGTTFYSDIRCDSNGHYLETDVVPNRAVGSQAVRTYVQTVSTGNWIVGPWHSFVNGMSDSTNDFTIAGHGYFKVYVQYAQYTTAGWVLNGEYINSYYQSTIYGGTVTSKSCYI